MAEFGPAVELVLAHEGGYVNDPNDPGGETNFGISKRQYPNEDIAGMTREGAKAIYERDYWRFSSLSDQALANCALDCAVNQGLPTAEKLLELSSHTGLREFQVQRLMRYVKLALAKPKMAGYLLGWFRRTLDC